MFPFNFFSEGKIFVNGRVRKEKSFPIGIMDVISIPQLKENYRIVYNDKGKFTAISISEKEAEVTVSKIVGKKVIKGGKIQLNMANGVNIIADKN